MAKYFLRCIHISRGKGARATRAAAYRAGERIRDERTSEVYDYTDRHDIAYKEVVVPSDLAGRPDMACALRTEPAVMASEIERLPDLTGYLKLASIPDWLAVKLTPSAAPANPRPRRPPPASAAPTPPPAPPDPTIRTPQSLAYNPKRHQQKRTKP